MEIISYGFTIRLNLYLKMEVKLQHGTFEAKFGNYALSFTVRLNFFPNMKTKCQSRTFYTFESQVCLASFFAA